MKTIMAVVACSSVLLISLPVVARQSTKPLSLRDSLNQNRAVKLDPPILITNTGSTNSAGYSIVLQPNGMASCKTTGISGVPEDLQRHQVPLVLVKRLYHDVQAAEPLAKLPVRNVFKSVSFGTSTFVIYGDQKTPDLSSAADARGMALAADVKDITTVLGVRSLPRRPIGTMPPLVPGR